MAYLCCCTRGVVLCDSPVQQYYVAVTCFRTIWSDTVWQYGVAILCIFTVAVPVLCTIVLF